MAKKKTHEEFVNEIKEKYGDEYIVLGEYKGANTKLMIKHNNCGHEWNVVPDSLLRGHGCPRCGRVKSNQKKRKMHEIFVKEIYDKCGDKYTVLGKYINTKTKVLVKHNCKECNFHEWEITPDNLLRGNGCPVCAGNKKKTTEDFKKEVYEKYGNEYIVLGEYINNNTKILIKHNSQDCSFYKYKTTPSSFLKGFSCPKCGGALKKTTKEFKKEIYSKFNDKYKILGEYVNAKTKIKVRHNCDKCNYHEWETIPNRLLNGQSCPVCSGREAKLGVNTIWDTDRWMVDLGVSEEDAKKYSKGSHKTIMVKCPDCGREKKTKPYVIYDNKSIFCSCGDGKSYPEKFVIELLNQLSVNFETEYSPDWVGNKRYDFYIKECNCIIETHGRQHYEKILKKGRTLKEEQVNDRFKKETALSHGIKYYIELDCRESNMKWIKNSIFNSKLSQLFDLSKVNWTSCAEFANKNIVKEVCDYWNNRKDGETTSDLGEIFHMHSATLSRYLKKGVNLGWCDYDPKEEIRKIARQNGKISGKKVEMFKGNKNIGVFLSCHELDRQSKKIFGFRLNFKGITRVCRGERKSYKGFTFKYVD